MFHYEHLFVFCLKIPDWKMIYVCFILLASIRNFLPPVRLQSPVKVFINCGYQVPGLKGTPASTLLPSSSRVCLDHKMKFGLTHIFSQNY